MALQIPAKFKVTQQELNQLRDIIRNIREAVVVTHIGPDQDAMMSLASWSHILQVNTTAVVRPIYEDNFLYEVADMKSLQVVERVPDLYESLVKYEPSHVFLVDLNSHERLTHHKNKLDKLKNFLETKTTTIIIDHHETPTTLNAHLKIIKPLASNCELLFNIAKELQLDYSKVAKELAIGILADTGMLEFSQLKDRPPTITTQALFELSKLNLDFREIVKRATMQLTPDLLPFIHEYMQNLTVEKHYAYTFLDHTNLTGNQSVSALRAKSFVLQTILAKIPVPIYYIVSAKQNAVKVSMRSEPPIAIRSIAEKLGGGGHDYSVGIYMKNADLNKTILVLNHEIETLLKQVSINN